jgi:hypothetical protein
MLRRVTGIGMLLLAASGCASLRGQIGDVAPADLTAPVASPTSSVQNAVASSISGSTSPASPIPTTEPNGSTPIETVQATTGRKNWGPVTNPPPAIEPPKITTGGPFTIVPDHPKQDPPSAEPVVIALQDMLEKRHIEGIEHLQAYGPLTRDVFQELLSVTAFMAHKGVEDWNADDAAVVELQLGRIGEMIRPRASLSISKLCFCDAVKDLRMYHPLPEDHAFLAARGDRPSEECQIYLEMKNLGSRPEAGQFVTDLACKFQIVDEQGKERWSFEFPLEKLRLVSRGPLIEYYHKFRFWLPENVTPGNYRLNVRLTDVTHAELPREATSSAPLHIVGDQ